MTKERLPRWLPYVLRRLNDLASRYGEKAQEGVVLVHPEALQRSPNVLGGILADDMPAPSVVPTLRGGVQFVWHRSGWDVEIEVLPSQTETWGRNRDTGQQFEGTLDQTRAELLTAVQQIEVASGNRQETSYDRGS